MSKRALLMDMPKTKKKRRFPGRRRLSFSQKVDLVVMMMDRNAAELTLLRGVSGWGFNLSQVAQMINYERSTALLNDLLKMCDEGHLFLFQRKRGASPLSNFEYWFYTPDEHGRALKRKKLL